MSKILINELAIALTVVIIIGLCIWLINKASKPSYDDHSWYLVSQASLGQDINVDITTYFGTDRIPCEEFAHTLQRNAQPGSNSTCITGAEVKSRKIKNSMKID